MLKCSPQTGHDEPLSNIECYPYINLQNEIITPNNNFQINLNLPLDLFPRNFLAGCRFVYDLNQSYN